MRIIKINVFAPTSSNVLQSVIVIRQHILENHKTGYIEKCQQIQEKKKYELRKLCLLQTTLRQLQVELEQVVLILVSPILIFTKVLHENTHKLLLQLEC